MSQVICPDAVITLVPHTCGACGVVFAMSERFVEERKKNHAEWYCPNGHARIFTGKTEAEKLRDELAAVRASRDQSWARQDELRRERDHERRRVNGYKGAVARVKRRVSKGRCPCCSHEFKNLKQHMAAEHPHWDPDKGAEALAK